MSEHAAIEIHDSTLVQLEYKENTLIATLRAYVHRSKGIPGVDPGSGWIQAVEIRLVRGHATGDVAEMPIELYDGRLVIDGQTFDNMVPLPYEFGGSVRLELEGANNLAVVLEGDAVAVVPRSAPEYVEDFKP